MNAWDMCRRHRKELQVPAAYKQPPTQAADISGMTKYALTLSTIAPDDRRVRVVTGLIVFIVVGCIAGCTHHNPLVCCVAADDCTQIGASAPEPCPNGLSCVQNECQTPGDAGVDVPSDTSSSCTTDMDCSGTTPFCSRDHVCVECVMSSQCPASAPACDPSTLTCRGCIADSDCASSVCDQSAGTCVDASEILYAAPSGSDVTSCTQTSPCSISHAIASATALRDIVSLDPGNYNATLTITNKTIKLHGYGATLTAAPSSNAVMVSDSGVLQVFGLSIVDLNAGNAGIAINCEPSSGTNPPTLLLDSVTVQSVQETVNANPCAVTITRSHLHVTSSAYDVFVAFSGATADIDRTVLDGGDGILAGNTNTVVHITNSVISNQTGADGAFSTSVLGSPAGSLVVSFSTIVDSLIACPTGTPVCAGGTAAGVCIDDSVVYNASSGAPADTISGAACQATYTLVYPQSTPVTGGNNKLGMNPLLVNVSSADYHLQASSPAIDSANPNAIDAHDFDGVARPQGVRSDMGAFEYH